MWGQQGPRNPKSAHGYPPLPQAKEHVGLLMTFPCPPPTALICFRGRIIPAAQNSQNQPLRTSPFGPILCPESHVRRCNDPQLLLEIFLAKCSLSSIHTHSLFCVWICLTPLLTSMPLLIVFLLLLWSLFFWFLSICSSLNHPSIHPSAPILPYSLYNQQNRGLTLTLQR